MANGNDDLKRPLLIAAPGLLYLRDTPDSPQLVLAVDDRLIIINMTELRLATLTAQGNTILAKRMEAQARYEEADAK